MRKNLTVYIDDEIIRRAKVRAILENISLSQVLERYLAEYSKDLDIKPKQKPKD